MSARTQPRRPPSSLAARTDAATPAVSIAPARTTWQQHLLHGAAIVLVTGIAYSGSFDGGFVSDDIRRVRDSQIIRSLDWSNIKQIFTTFDGANYMPLKVLSLAVDYRLFGPAPPGFHFTNLLLHIGCTLLVYTILMRLEMRPLTACLTALLWGIHPLQVESVAWISERKNVLSGLFFLAAFHIYLGFSERRRAGDYVWVVVLYALALLSKMNTMVLPAICLAYEMTFRFRLRAVDIGASLPLFGLAALAAWYNLTGNPIHGASWHANSVVITWLSSSVVLFRYLGNLLVPIDLQVWYDVPLRDSLADPAVLAAMFGIGGIVAATIALVAARNRLSFWILWFGIVLLPMLNIVVPFRAMMQDRYMHLAMLGPLALAATLLDDATHSRTARGLALAASVAAIVACTVLTLRQVEVWGSPLTMWQEGALRRITIPGDRTQEVADYDRKLAFLEVASERAPSAVTHNNRGALYYQVGQVLRAVREFETAARLDPDSGGIAINLGRGYARLGQLEAAQEQLERAVRVKPYWGLVRVNLARVYLAQGNAPAARRELDAAERIQPHAPWVTQQERALLRRIETGDPGGGTP
jgi:hypothetical protein